MSRPRKRSFSIGGHKTSVSLEPAFWEALREVAAAERLALAALVAQIDRSRGAASLSGALRVHVLQHFRSRAAGSTAMPAVPGRPDAEPTT